MKKIFKKNLTNFFMTIYIIHKNDIITFLKLSINKYHKDIAN